VSYFVQAASAFAADVRALVDDVSRGFVVGGVAGAIVVVFRKARIPDAKRSLILSRWTLAGVIAFLLFILIFD
jgi:hypothetical protein